MTYRVRIARVAQRQIDEFAVYLRAYSEEFAVEQIERLNQTIAVALGEAPLAWPYFPLTGAPYRAYLFRVGRHAQFWIIYTVDEDARVVDILDFWSVRRDPELLE